MARCVEIGKGGALIDVSPQPSDVTTCALVVASGYEHGQFSSSPWVLTEAQGAQIGGAILFVWAIAWGIRALARALLHTDEEKET